MSLKITERILRTPSNFLFMSSAIVVGITGRIGKQENMKFNFSHGKILFPLNGLQ